MTSSLLTFPISIWILLSYVLYSHFKQIGIISSNMKQISSFFRCFHSNRKMQLPANSVEYDEVADIESMSKQNLCIFNYNQLKAVTQGFNHKIGEGGFGSVYKGRLRGDKFLAVKVLSVEKESMRGEREFVSEIVAMCGIRHENLVTLRGCCVHGGQRLLVFDYMENNSIAHTFLGREQKRLKFTWALRKQVILGTGKGLCYLHEEISPHIVHRDIKASNILLDQDFTPKLADFGLARLFRDNKSYISTRVAGTLGYLSPEYAHSGHLTRKSDVYSFGVLLLEIVSGLPVVDYHLDYGEQFLVDKAWGLYNSKNLLELVDCALKGDFPEEEAVRFLKVGLLCVQEITRLRPRTSTALKMLSCSDISTDDVEISQPGVIADLMDVKIRKKQSSHFTSSPAKSSTGSFLAR